MSLKLVKRIRELPIEAFGVAPEDESISPTKAIQFALSIDDHYDMREFLRMWTEGQWRELRKQWPTIDTTGRAPSPFDESES